VKKSFNIQELLHRKFKFHGTKSHAPLLVESFPTPRRRTPSEASRFGLQNKANYLPS
jgi:hypothetical protein